MSDTNFQIGQDVSKRVVTDSYYAGKIVRMTKTLIITDQGLRFSKRRRKGGRGYDGQPVYHEYYAEVGERHAILKPGRHEYLDMSI